MKNKFYKYIENLQDTITSTLENATADIVILRLNTNGTLDTSFGANGTTITDFNGNTEFAGSIYIQNSGKILTTNSISYATSGSNADILFIQYNEDGTLDGGFNSDGIKTSDLGENEYLTSAMSDNNGKLVVLGEQESTTSGNGLSIFVARYEIDNSLSVENLTTGLYILQISGADYNYSAKLVIKK